MPPKVKFTKDQVLNIAFKIVENNGLEALTARTVARELKSSVAPVYSYFDSMEDLKYAVIKKAAALLIDYTLKPYSDEKLLNIGVGFVIFARDYRHLYRSMFLECADYAELVEEFRRQAKELLKKEDRFLLLAESEVEEMFDHLWTYAHGLAALICAGLIKDVSEVEIMHRLNWTGDVIAEASLLKSNQK